LAWPVCLTPSEAIGRIIVVVIVQLCTSDRPVIEVAAKIGIVSEQLPYILNDKGHIQSDTLIVSADDAQAIEAAKKIVGARNVELRDGELPRNSNSRRPASG
jgi:hypothetical protein